MSSIPVPAHNEGLSFIGAKAVGLAATKYVLPNDQLRFTLATRTAEAYSQKGLPLVYVDGGSSEEVIQAFISRGVVVYKAPRPGLATQYLDGVQFILKHEGQTAIIIKQEPEKVDTLDALGFQLQHNDIFTRYDLTIVGRTPASMKTVPVLQRIVEYYGGEFMEKELGLPCSDPMCGIQVYSTPAAVDCFLAYETLIKNDPKGFNNWVYLYETPLMALRRGLKVGSYITNLRYPPEVKQEEENNAAFDNKRVNQLRMQLDTMAQLHPELIPNPLEAVSRYLADVSRELAAMLRGEIGLFI